MATSPKTMGLTGAIAIAAGLVIHFEGVNLVSYLDPPGIPTICFGHTGAVVSGATATLKQCESLLKSDLMAANDVFDRLVTVSVSDNTRAAFLSFIFNVGSGNFAKSTLLKKLNHGDKIGACNELLRWNKSRGKVLAGLDRRRKEEHKLCMAGL